MVRFDKVVVTALRWIIVSNCSNLELGSIRHKRLLHEDNFLQLLDARIVANELEMAVV